jgi:hypothetical protein
MVTTGVHAATALCMFISLMTSYLAGRRLESVWLKLAVFAFATIVGTLSFPLIGGLWAGARPEEEYLIDPAFRQQIGTAIIGTVVMAYFGIWRLQEVIDSRRKP